MVKVESGAEAGAETASTALEVSWERTEGAGAKAEKAEAKEPRAEAREDIKAAGREPPEGRESEESEVAGER